MSHINYHNTTQSTHLISVMSDFISVIVSGIISAALHIANAMGSEGVGQEATAAQQLAEADAQVTDPP